MTPPLMLHRSRLMAQHSPCMMKHLHIPVGSITEALIKFERNEHLPVYNVHAQGRPGHHVTPGGLRPATAAVSARGLAFRLSPCYSERRPSVLRRAACLPACVAF